MVTVVVRAAASLPDDDDRRAAILGVARTCFERYGVHRTRIEDVADEAGLSRPMVYRFFATRQDLIDAVLLDYLRELCERVRPRILAYDTLAEAVVEGVVLLVEGARSNPELTALATTAKPARLNELLHGPNRLAQLMAADIWHPLLERARAAGEVKDDLVEADFVDWLSTIHLAYWLRPDVDYDDLRRLLWAYLAPALHHSVPPRVTGSRRAAGRARRSSSRAH